MRIAHVVPPGDHPYSGLLTALMHAASALAERGHVVELWQQDDQLAEHGAFEPLIARAGVRRVRLADAERGGGERTEVVHLHGVFNVHNVRIARRLRVPYVLSPHGGYAAGTLSYHRARKALFATLCERPMMRRAAAVCALTAAEAEDVRRFGARAPVAVVPNGVTPAAAGVSGAAFRHALGLAPSTPLALYLGRIDVRQKRLDDLVRGVAAAPGWHAALVGPDFRGGAAQLARLVGALGVADRIHLVGPRHGGALHEALAAATVFVLLSRSEGMPMALLEAATHGVPAVVSPEVECAVRAAALGGGWLTSPRDLVHSLRRIDDLDAIEWTRRRAAARALSDDHSWPSAAAAYEAVYAAVLARGTASDDAGSSDAAARS